MQRANIKRVGIVGAGRIGQAIARIARRAGRPVVIANKEGPQSLASLVQELGDGVSAGNHPLLPLHIIWDRGRGGAYTTIALAGACIFGVFLFLTYFLQEQLGLSPLTTGLAFLPLTGVLVVTSTTVQTRVIQLTGSSRWYSPARRSGRPRCSCSRA
jgi:threonine dehydrogenase-like Zn-dependent dehydrogenase